MKLDEIKIDRSSTENAQIKVEKILKKDIAIVGIGLKLPLADDIEMFWRNMRAGIDCTSEFPEGRKRNLLVLEEVLLKAWSNGDINPETLSYVKVHGTGIALEDPIEIEGIQNAFSQYSKRK